MISSSLLYFMAPLSDILTMRTLYPSSLAYNKNVFLSFPIKNTVSKGINPLGVYALEALK